MASNDVLVRDLARWRAQAFWLKAYAEELQALLVEKNELLARYEAYFRLEKFATEKTEVTA